MTTHPPMKGVGARQANQEIHIFLAPLNPDEATLQQYYDRVAQWNANERGPDMPPMKACHLALIFRKDGVDTEVCVMQSARYLRSDNPAHVVAECEADAHFFEQAGFDVIRQKIEASAYGIEGIPRTDAEASALGRYFEFHIKVQRKDAANNERVSDAEANSLKQVSRRFSRLYQVPVPLSFNKNKDCVTGDGKGSQRFLNVRFRDAGLDETIRDKVAAIEQALEHDTVFRHLKTISEYVWYDTNTAMDQGWIDFTPSEFAAAYSS